MEREARAKEGRAWSERVGWAGWWNLGPVDGWGFEPRISRMGTNGF